MKHNINLVLFCWQDGDRLYVGAVGSWYWQGEYSFSFGINTRDSWYNCHTNTNMSNNVQVFGLLQR